MFRMTNTIRRIGAGLALAAALTAVLAPQALAGSGVDGRSPDTRDAALTAHTSKYGPPDPWYSYAVAVTKASKNAPVTDGRSPDTRDAALKAESAGYGAPDRWFTRVVDGRSPDTRDFAIAARQQPTTLVDGRSPDTRDFA